MLQHGKWLLLLYMCLHKQIHSRVEAALTESVLVIKLYPFLKLFKDLHLHMQMHIGKHPEKFIFYI